jgi:hypothetical protein
MASAMYLCVVCMLQIAACAGAAAEVSSSDNAKEIIHKAMLASFLHDRETILNCYGQLKSDEDTLHYSSATTLSDNVYALLIGCGEDREAQLRLSYETRAFADDDYSRAIAYGSLNSDELLR